MKNIGINAENSKKEDFENGEFTGTIDVQKGGNEV